MRRSLRTRVAALEAQLAPPPGPSLRDRVDAAAARVGCASPFAQLPAARPLGVAPLSTPILADDMRSQVSDPYVEISRLGREASDRLRKANDLVVSGLQAQDDDLGQGLNAPQEVFIRRVSVLLNRAVVALSHRSSPRSLGREQRVGGAGVARTGPGPADRAGS